MSIHADTKSSAGHVASRALTGLVFSMFGTGLSRVFLFVALLLTSRILGVSHFGEFGAIQTTVVTWAGISALGLGGASTRYVAMYINTDPRRAQGVIGFVFAITVFTAGAASLMFFFAASFIAGNLMNAAQLAGMLAISSPAVLFVSLQSVQIGVFTGLEAFRLVSGLSAFAGLTTLILVPAGARVAGPYGALIGLVLAGGMSCVINHFAMQSVLTRRGLRIRPVVRGEYLPIVYQFGLPLLVADAMVNVGLWVATVLVLGGPKGSSEVGMFAAANQWYSALLLLPSVVGTVFMPVLSERLGSQDKNSAFVLFTRSSLLIAAIGLPIAVVGTLMSPWIIGLNGQDFRNGSPVLVVMVWTALVQAVLAPLGSIVQASGRMWFGVLMNAAWTATLLLAFHLMPEKNAYGLALARLAAFMAHTVWCAVFSIIFFKDQMYAFAARLRIRGDEA